LECPETHKFVDLGPPPACNQRWRLSKVVRVSRVRIMEGLMIRHLGQKEGLG
jgi:hypothetical protein